jgi:hypothetical protein
MVMGRQCRIAVPLAAALCLAPLAVAGAGEARTGVVLGPPIAIVNPSPEFIPAPIAPSPSAAPMSPPAPLPPQVLHVAPVLAVPRVTAVPPPAPVPSRR